MTSKLFSDINLASSFAKFYKQEGQEIVLRKLKSLYYLNNISRTHDGARVDASSLIRKAFTIERLQNEGFKVEDRYPNTRSIHVIF